MDRFRDGVALNGPRTGAVRRVRRYNAAMHRPGDPSSTIRSPLPSRDERAVLRTAGIAAAITGGAVIAWLGGDRILQAIVDLWLHTMLPAFHALLISGLGLCS